MISFPHWQLSSILFYITCIFPVIWAYPKCESTFPSKSQSECPSVCPVLFRFQQDCGANGGLAGSDMRVIHKLQRKINIQGIDNHEVTGLDVVTPATLLNISQGKVIGIFNEYAIIHSFIRST